MEYSTDIQMVLDSLSKDKKELLDKVNNIDRLIKRIKYGNLNLGLNKVAKPESDSIEDDNNEQYQVFPMKSELKVQVIRYLIFWGLPVNLKMFRISIKSLQVFTTIFEKP